MAIGVAFDSIIEYFRFEVFSALGGVRIAPLLALLWRHRREIEARYYPRAAYMTLNAVCNSTLGRVEDLLYGRAVRATSILPPVFILGHWRSGTSHLQRLLAVDERFAYPNLYQATAPQIFLTTERWASPLVRAFVPGKRLYDDMSQTLETPWEDETALCGLTMLSPLMALVFPSETDGYRRFLTLRQVSPREREQWKSALLWFMRKLTLRYRRPLLLKSPPHTARLSLLLELFPDARFLHIFRDPYAVVASTCHMLRTFSRVMRLEKDGRESLEENVITDFREMYAAFYAARPGIASGRFAEVRFEDLERHPLEELDRIYRQSGLGDFAAVRPAMEDYLRSVSHHRKGSYRPLPQASRARIAGELESIFRQWGYAR